MRINDDTLFPRRQRKLMIINCHSLIKHNLHLTQNLLHFIESSSGFSSGGNFWHWARSKHITGIFIITANSHSPVVICSFTSSIEIYLTLAALAFKLFSVHITLNGYFKSIEFLILTETNLVEIFTGVFIFQESDESLIFIVEVVSVAIPSIRISFARGICITWSVCKSTFVCASFATFASVWPFTDTIAVVVLETFWTTADILTTEKNRISVYCGKRFGTSVHFSCLLTHIRYTEQSFYSFQMMEYKLAILQRVHSIQ